MIGFKPQDASLYGPTQRVLDYARVDGKQRTRRKQGAKASNGTSMILTQRALPLLKKYDGTVWVLGGVNPEYFTVLQKVGKQNEIEKATDERARSNRVDRGPS